MDFHDSVEAAGKAVDALGVIVTIAGVVFALGRYGVGFLRTGPGSDYTETRRTIGRSVLLGLEILVAGDIIRTVAVTPTFTSVGVLAVIVALRTFLSLSLEYEISGRLPFQRRSTSSAVQRHV